MCGRKFRSIGVREFWSNPHDLARSYNGWGCCKHILRRWWDSMNWWKLRPIGNLAVLKVSYTVLVVIPFFSHYKEFMAFLGIKAWFLGVLFFASLFLGLANLLYDIACPVIVKRFASPNDLYKAMIEIKTTSVQAYPQDQFQASYEHCEAAYRKAAFEKVWLRRLCFFFYISAGTLFLMAFIYRAILVFQMLF